MWQYEALANPTSALARWALEPNYVADGAQEAGETVAHTYQWIHTLNAAGQVDKTITANTPTYAVFKDPGTGKRTCAAYNPTDTRRTVTFSNGFVLSLAPYTLGSTPVGGCVTLGQKLFLPMTVQ